MADSAYLRQRFSGSSWGGGGGETPCGSGSTVAYTEFLRDAIPPILETYDIKVLNDAGCGDMNWISLLASEFETAGVDYLGYDVRTLVDPPLPYEKLEIVHERMRPCDLILCKDVFIHLPDEMVLTALANFRAVSKYLLSTTFPLVEHGSERAIRGLGGGFARINLEDPRYGLGEPLEAVAEPQWQKNIALWKL